MLDDPIILCTACGTEIAHGLLSCPGCRRLTHAEELKQLANRADQAEAASAPSDALVLWREALELLPRNTKQAQSIEARISRLGLQVDASPRPARPRVASTEPGGTRKPWSSLAGLGTLALVVASKAKFLLLGLTKSGTILTMIASLGVYWAAFGWKFALGLVLSIYIHEMGHVAMLIRYGIKASAPLFIPGLGAFIRLNQSLGDARQDARVGLAGPVWGLAAAAGSYAVFLLSNFQAWGAIAKLGAWINLFNLTPFWQLDGGRAFRALSRPQRWMAATAIAVAWALTNEGLLLLLLLVAGMRAAFDRPPTQSDRGSLLTYILLVAALSALTLVPVAIH